MILATPAPATRNVPVVSPIRSIDPKGSTGAQTILFKNVLDGLETFETPVDENIAGEQNTGSRGTPFNTTSNTTSNKMSGAQVTGKTLPDQAPLSQQHIAPQHIALQQAAPQIPFPSQNLAQLTATLSAPTQETEQPKENAAPQGLSATNGEPLATQADVQPSVVERSTVPSAALLSQSLPISHWNALAPAARSGVSIQTPSTPANSAPAKSSRTEASTVAAPLA